MIHDDRENTQCLEVHKDVQVSWTYCCNSFAQEFQGLFKKGESMILV